MVFFTNKSVSIIYKNRKGTGVESYEILVLSSQETALWGHIHSKSGTNSVLSAWSLPV